MGNDLYPLVRLLVPDVRQALLGDVVTLPDGHVQRDRYRATYGTKEQVLAKIYISVLSLAKTSASADRLLRWKQPTRDSVSALDHAIQNPTNRSRRLPLRRLHQETLQKSRTAKLWLDQP